MQAIYNTGVAKAKRDFALRKSLKLARSSASKTTRRGSQSVIHQIIKEGEMNARLLGISNPKPLADLIPQAILAVKAYSALTINAKNSVLSTLRSILATPKSPVTLYVQPSGVVSATLVTLPAIIQEVTNKNTISNGIASDLLFISPNGSISPDIEAARSSDKVLVKAEKAKLEEITRSMMIRKLIEGLDAKPIATSVSGSKGFTVSPTESVDTLLQRLAPNAMTPEQEIEYLSTIPTTVLQ